MGVDVVECSSTRQTSGVCDIVGISSVITQPACVCQGSEEGQVSEPGTLLPPDNGDMFVYMSLSIGDFFLPGTCVLVTKYLYL